MNYFLLGIVIPGFIMMGILAFEPCDICGKSGHATTACELEEK